MKFIIRIISSIFSTIGLLVIIWYLSVYSRIKPGDMSFLLLSYLQGEDSTLQSSRFTEKAFAQIVPGLTADEVTAVLGKPLIERITACGKSIRNGVQTDGQFRWDEQLPVGCDVRTASQWYWDFTYQSDPLGNYRVRELEFHDGRVKRIIADYYWD